MSRTKKAKTEDEEEDLTKDLPFDQKVTQNYFNSKEIKPLHLNFEEFRGNYLVSTGSLFFDKTIGGGFSSGLIRFVGPNECGKSAEALEIQSNFLKQVPNSKGIYVKAEGRLSETMKGRVETKFVSDPLEWVDGTCLVFECNVYEVIFDWIRLLLLDPKNKTRYHIIIDSMDSLIPKDALEKSTGDSPKVAAGALFSADFLKRTNIYLSKRGHQCIMIAQIRAEIKASQYTVTDKNKMGGGSGGNAQVHFPDWIVEFLRPNKDDFIVPNDKEKISEKNKALGKNACIKILKSTNESTLMHVTYPVKFGRVGKSAIWKEREVVDILLAWGLISKTGSWFSSDEELKEKLEVEFKVHGIDAVYDLLENDEVLFNKLLKFVSNMI